MNWVCSSTFRMRSSIACLTAAYWTFRSTNSILEFAESLMVGRPACVVGNGVALAACLAFDPGAIGQPHPALAHPADAPRRVADDEGVGGDVPGDDGAGADERVLADRVPAHHGGVGADRCSAPHQRLDRKSTRLNSSHLGI